MPKLEISKKPVGVHNLAVKNITKAIFGIDETETTPFYGMEKDKPDLIGSIVSDQNGTLLVEFSPEGGIGGVVTHSISIPIVGGPATEDSAICIKSAEPFVRFTYTNGGVVQSSFTLNLYGTKL